MKNKIIFTFIIASILNCFENKEEGLSREFYLMYVLPAIQDMQRNATNICNHLDTLEELSPGNTYEFYNKYGTYGKIPFKSKGIKIYIEVLQVDRTLYPIITKCLNNTSFPSFYLQYNINNEYIEYIGGKNTYRGIVAESGFPLTIKVWDNTYRYYIFKISSEKTSGYYEDAQADFKITISEL